MPSFEIGDKVLVLNPKLRRGKAKLDAPWSGPYIVSGKASKVAYLVTANNKEKRVHVERLKLFRARI